MQLEEYQVRAGQLSFYHGLRHGDGFDQALQMALEGLVGEYLKEIEPLIYSVQWRLTPELSEELGDLMWYVAEYATTNGVQLWRYTPRPVGGGLNRTHFLNKFREVLGTIAETTKKRVHHKKLFEDMFIETQCYTLHDYVVFLIKRLGGNYEEILGNNIAKLEARHGKTTRYGHV